ncbi:MAG: hypothetical protein NZ841_06150 [Dictyoglomus sp.]|nr:hypothetical protein [Dictyoglomus sp.]MDW8188860.1 hypothetical protein [Dictyoglomus sp.]
MGKGSQCQTPSLRKKEALPSIQKASMESNAGEDLSGVAGARQIIPAPNIGIKAS